MRQKEGQMKNRIVALLTLGAFALGASGCATVSPEHEGAATGAGIGAATGAIAGAVLAGEGSRTKGAIIGGLAGALLGGVIGNYTVDKKRSAQETTTKYDYQPSDGTVVRIENTQMVPTSLNRGDTIQLKATYAVMAPSSESLVSVTESREVTLNGELVANPEITVQRTAGTYTSTIPLMLPGDARPGNYRVITTVKTASGRDSRQSTFTVN
jgi:surface antigen